MRAKIDRDRSTFGYSMLAAHARAHSSRSSRGENRRRPREPETVDGWNPRPAVVIRTQFDTDPPVERG
jgi:hypothetical protein